MKQNLHKVIEGISFFFSSFGFWITHTYTEKCLRFSHKNFIQERKKKRFFFFSDGKWKKYEQKKYIHFTVHIIPTPNKNMKWISIQKKKNDEEIPTAFHFVPHMPHHLFAINSNLFNFFFFFCYYCWLFGICFRFRFSCLTYVIPTYKLANLILIARTKQNYINVIISKDYLIWSPLYQQHIRFNKVNISGYQNKHTLMIESAKMHRKGKHKQWMKKKNRLK